MAEEKKTPKPRKPRAPKTQPKIEETSELKVVEEVTEVEEETKLPEIVEPAPEETPSEEETTGEVGPVEETTLDPEPEEDILEPPVEETELPEDAPTYEEFSSSLETSSVEIKKLNPNLPDSKSKWVAQIPYGNHSIHILFKGSYVKTLQAARNYNKARGFSSNVKEIRSN